LCVTPLRKWSYLDKFNRKTSNRKVTTNDSFCLLHFYPPQADSEIACLEYQVSSIEY
jgi:hypothetical protein